ncbi:hypothetical protein [Streptantibioticus ferralitis]|uniref:DUF11 domain-containing protein n=1 Tax=Streptantibioticus ferralitis TaxID=236510 RepID=A0ABT5ZAX1_9ACTN|nr:hypothetical protein [Streptantibioticus ferralitis]MDF2260996.1 hypothetical protein [Streptantibioticus ferralitis]
MPKRNGLQPASGGLRHETGESQSWSRLWLAALVLLAGLALPALTPVQPAHAATGRTSASARVSVQPSQPSLAIAKTHEGRFVQGRKGVYTINVGNDGSGPTDGTPVIVHDTLPRELVPVSMTGAGWDCTLSTLTCTNSAVLGAGFAYTPITLTVKITCHARGTVTNRATVTGGGDTTIHTATNTTTIRRSERCHHHHHHHHRHHHHRHHHHRHHHRDGWHRH